MTKYGLTYTIGMDVTGAIFRTYRVFGLPTHYFIDRNGIVVLSYVDADYTTRLEPTEIAVALAHLRARANPSSSVC